jgi:hypothetical protein
MEENTYFLNFLGIVYIMASFTNFLSLTPLRANEIVERKTNLLYETVKCLPHQSCLPKTMWSTVIQVACYLLNKC